MKNQRIIFLGLGEIGSSIARLYNNDEYHIFYSDPAKSRESNLVDLGPFVLRRSLSLETSSKYTNSTKTLRVPSTSKTIKVLDGPDYEPEEWEHKPFEDILHVSIPYSEDFEDIVSEWINAINPMVTIIHSTVKPKTSRRIYLRTNAAVVHSPVMGRHPNLTESIQTFEKIVGPTTKGAGELAVSHFHDLGVSCEWYNSAEESEVAKIMSTTYYGWNIIFEKMAHDYCHEHALDFGNVYRRTNQIYNKGYTELGEEKFVRPVLDHVPGKIGGHCVRQNCDLIDFVPSGTVKFYNDNLGEKK